MSRKPFSPVSSTMQQEHGPESDIPMENSLDHFDPFYNENGNYESNTLVGTNNQPRERDGFVGGSTFVNDDPSLLSDSPTFGGFLSDLGHDAQESTLTPRNHGQEELSFATNYAESLDEQETRGAGHHLPDIKAIQNRRSSQTDEAQILQLVRQDNLIDDSYIGHSETVLPRRNEQYHVRPRPPATSSSSAVGYGSLSLQQSLSYKTSPYTPGAGYVMISGEHYLPQGPPEPEFDGDFLIVNADIGSAIHNARNTGDLHGSYRLPYQRAGLIDIVESPPDVRRPRKEQLINRQIANEQLFSQHSLDPSQKNHDASYVPAYSDNNYAGYYSIHQDSQQGYVDAGPHQPRNKTFLLHNNHQAKQQGQIRAPASRPRTANDERFSSGQHVVDTQNPHKPQAGPSEQCDFGRNPQTNISHEPAFPVHIPSHQGSDHQNLPTAAPPTRRRLTFSNLAQAEPAMFNRGTEHNWTPPVDDFTIPETDSDRAEWVAQLLDAFQDINECSDKKGKVFQNRWANPDVPFYNAEEMEKVCWKLLDVAERLHHHGPLILQVYDSTAMREVRKSRDSKFENRMQGICRLLRYSKARCEKLMKGEGLDLTVGCPFQKLSLSAMNHRQNDDRQGYIAEGRVKIKGEENVGKRKAKGVKKAVDIDKDSSEVEEDADTASAANRNPHSHKRSLDEADASDTSGSRFKRPRRATRS